MSIPTDVRYESTTTDLCLRPVPGIGRPGSRSSNATHDSCARSPRSSGSRNPTPRTSRRTRGCDPRVRGTIRDPEARFLARDHRAPGGVRIPPAVRPEVATESAGDGSRPGSSRGRRRGRRDGRRGPASRRRAQRPPAAPRERAVLPVARHQLRRGVAPNGAAGGKHRSDPDPDAEATAPDALRDGTRRIIGGAGTPTAGSPRRPARRPAG